VISHARASSLFIFLSVGYGISVLVSGFYSGRFGYKKSIMLSLVFSTIACFLIPFIRVFLVLCISVFILGFSAGIYLPSAIPLLTEHFTETNWGKVIAIHDSGVSVAIFSTPIVALLLLHFFQWRWAFAVLAFVCLVCIGVFYISTDELRIRCSQKTTVADLLKMRSLWLIATMLVFAAGANLGVYVIIPLYLTKELSLDIGYANTILGISRLVSIAVAVLCGFLADRFSLKRTLFIMMLLTGILTVLLGMASVRFTALCLFLQALFVTGLFPLGFVAISKISSRETRGLAMGIISTMGMVIGGGLIPYFLGICGDLLSFRFGISALGVVVIMSSGLIFFLKELK
jgi:NNP family nitrate/nitrite transporter-like MFS transporter